MYLEDISQIGMLVVAGTLFILILASIRLAKEHERFAYQSGVDRPCHRPGADPSPYLLRDRQDLTMLFG